MPFNWIRFISSSGNISRANKPYSGVALYDGQHNTRYSFSFEAPATLRPKVLYMKLAGDTENPESSWSLTIDGSTNSYAYPSELNSEYWIPVRILSTGVISISRAGPVTSKNIDVQFRVFEGG